MLKNTIKKFFIIVIFYAQTYCNFSNHLRLDVRKSIDCIRGTITNYLNIAIKVGVFSNELFFKQLNDVCGCFCTSYPEFYAIVNQKTLDAVIDTLSVDLPDDLFLEDLVTNNEEVTVDLDQDTIEALLETLHEDLPDELLLKDLVKYVAERKVTKLPINKDQVIVNVKINNSENLSDCITDSMIKYYDAVEEKGPSEELSSKQMDEMYDCYYNHDNEFLLRENQKLRDTLIDNLNNLATEIPSLFEDLSTKSLNSATIDTHTFEWVSDLIINEIPALNEYLMCTLNTHWGSDTEKSVKLYDKQKILKLDEFIEQSLNNNIDYSYLDFDFGSFVLIEYLPIMVALILALLLSCFIVIISYFLSIQNPEIEKISTYECGFEPYEDARHKVGIKFYIFAILFIIFDVETMYLIPWCMSLSITNYVGYWIMIDFLFELGVSFLYVWLVGGLDWD